MESILWGDIATWFTGIITLGLFIIGFIQIYNERNERKQRDEKLEDQIKKAQAENISSWIVSERGENVLICIQNLSHQPVYQAVICIAIIHQDGSYFDTKGEHKSISVIPPGVGYINTKSRYHGMHRRAGIEIAFKDVTDKIGYANQLVNYYK